MYTLREYQTEAIKATVRYMKRNEGKHPLVAIPTGSGKSLIIAGMIEHTLNKWPDTNILVVSHVKEILEQNYKAISNYLDMDVGLFSAGLDSREVKQITVAGIQSIYNKAELFQGFKLVIIDEAHLIPPKDNSMYRKLFAGLNNPRYFGLTATPFRMNGGYIYGEGEHLFDALVYDLTSLAAFNDLIDQGYLCRLRTKATTTEFDVETVRTVGGDFDLKEMSTRFNREAITRACIREVVAAGQDYKKWLLFAIDIEHANAITHTLREMGISAMAVHSLMGEDRDELVAAYKAGEFRALVNVNMLTTGFDDPEIDLIALLRPTKSPVIHVQTIGRGLRIFEGKDHCLVLDFAGNTERLGPINDIHVYKKRKGKGGKPITKRCPGCDAIHHPAVRVCDSCGHVFLFATNLHSLSGRDTEVVRETRDQWLNVSGIVYEVHHKANRPDSVRVIYQSGLRDISEFVCLDHPGYAGHKARHWVKYRGGSAATTRQFMEQRELLNQPKRILVEFGHKHPIVKDYIF